MTWLPDSGRKFDMAMVAASRPFDVNRSTMKSDWSHRSGLLIYSFLPVIEESERKLEERWHDAEEGGDFDPGNSGMNTPLGTPTRACGGTLM